MKKKRIIWWVCFIILFVACVGSIIHAKILHSVHGQLVSRLGKEITENFDDWKELEIDGQDPLLFHKNLHVTHEIEFWPFYLTIILGSITIIFLLVSVVVSRKKEAKE